MLKKPPPLRVSDAKQETEAISAQKIKTQRFMETIPLVTCKRAARFSSD
jgi:hypothetical protein